MIILFQAVSVSATGAAASAESLQHQTASLENLLARSRVYEQQRDTSIASTLSTLTSGESLQSGGGAGSAHTLDSVPEERAAVAAAAAALADDATPPMAPRALTIARSAKKAMTAAVRKSSSKEKVTKESTPNLTIHDAINNARNAAISKLEPATKEGDAPARRDVIVFNKGASGELVIVMLYCI